MGGSAARLNAGDDRLLRDVRGGDETAFAELYDRHAAELHAYCRHLLGSGHDAEDVLQQTFWKAYRRMRQGRHAIAFRPWLFTIARNECLRMLRRRADRSQGPEASCAGIRVQLITLSGGSLRRRILREHLLACPGCREFRVELRAASAAPLPRKLRMTSTVAVSGARSIRTGA